ncbi:MAG: glycosyltransferase family 4 protein [Patescibacteria group bacterium]
MKNILLFTRPLSPPWDEASKNLAYEIAFNSQKKNLRFEVLTTQNSAGYEKTLPDKIIQRKIYSKNRFDGYEKIRLILYFLLGKKSFQIIHFLFTPRLLTSFIIRSRLTLTSSKTIQTIATIPDKNLQNKSKLKKILFADKIVAQSDYTLKKIQEKGFGNVELIYPGINMKKFFPKNKLKKVLKEMKLNQNNFVVLFAGEYTRLRAIDDIIKAAEIIFENGQNKDIKLILACRIKSSQDKGKKEEIIQQVKQKSFSKQILFKETVENMADLYNLSDVNIFPVREMAGKFDIPLAIVEAMACKKPVIISDIPVLQEFIKNEKNGLITPKANPEKLAENILKLKRNSKLREKISQAGFNFVRKNFDIEKNIKKYHKLYQEMVKDN